MGIILYILFLIFCIFAGFNGMPYMFIFPIVTIIGVIVLWNTFGNSNNTQEFNDSLVLGYYFFAIIKKQQKKEAENKQNWNIHINKFLQLKQNKSIIKQIFIIPIQKWLKIC